MAGDLAPCIHEHKDISESACAELVLRLDSSAIATCRTKCARGIALAMAAKHIKADSYTDPAFMAARPASPAKHVSCMDAVLGLTGCKSVGALGAKLGFPAEALRQQFRRLDAGKPQRSDNKILPALIKFTGLTLEQLSHPDTIQRLETAAPIPAVDASSQTQPSGVAAPSSAAPEGPAEGGSGSNLAEAPAQYDPNTGDVVEMPGQAPPVLVNVRGEEKPISAVLREVLERGDFLEGFIPFDPAAPKPENEPGPAVITVDKAGAIGISSAAARRFNLLAVQTVRLLFNPATGQLALQPGYTGPGARKVTRKNNSYACKVSAAQALRQWGVRPALHSSLLTPGPGGLLVATIAPAQAGKEA